MEAKKAAGYFTGGPAPDARKLAETKGRGTRITMKDSAGNVLPA